MVSQADGLEDGAAVGSGGGGESSAGVQCDDTGDIEEGRIVTDLADWAGDAYKALAESLDKGVVELTANEKRQALHSAIFVAAFGEPVKQGDGDA